MPDKPIKFCNFAERARIRFRVFLQRGRQIYAMNASFTAMSF